MGLRDQNDRQLHTWLIRAERLVNHSVLSYQDGIDLMLLRLIVDFFRVFCYARSTVDHVGQPVRRL